MKNTRLIVETTPERKAALGGYLRDTGTTFSDWLNLKIDEAMTVSDVLAWKEPSDELLDLGNLRDSKGVMCRLREIDWAFTKDRTGYLLHDLHPYPAKFIPQIPQNLIRLLTLRGELVWDPFGGSGTTALEALLLGRRAVSTDANPLAQLIGKAKTTSLREEDDHVLTLLSEELRLAGNNVETLRDLLKRNEPQYSLVIPKIPNLEKWFHPVAIRELAYLRWRCSTLPTEATRILAEACLSKVIVKASYQDGETRYARRVREVEFGSVLRMFAAELGAATVKSRQMGKLLRFRNAEFLAADLRADNLPLQRESVDLVVTSPPYPNAMDYHLYHRFRLFWLGHDPRELGKCEIGSHLRHQKESSGFDSYCVEMESCLRNIFSVLRKGRYAVFVLGDSVFGGKTFRTGTRIAEVGRRVGFEFVGRIERPLPTNKRSFISAARRLRTEDIIVLRKPSEHIDVLLERPKYKLWAYEEVLSKKEISTLAKSEAVQKHESGWKVKIDALEAGRLRALTFSRSAILGGSQPELTWQAVLERGDVSSGRKDPKYATHGIHAYKGKFYPQLAKSLFNLADLRPGDVVLDPFAGSGTVLLEAYLNGLRGVGLDLNPLAVKIARAKTSVLADDPFVVDRLLKRFEDRLQELRPKRDWASVFDPIVHEELKSWFPAPVLQKLAAIMQEVTTLPDAKLREFIEVVLSSIVRDISQQDPKDLRIRRRDTPISDAPVFDLLREMVIDQRRRLREFAERSNRCPSPVGSASAALADSRQWEGFVAAGIERASVDAIVTSPPYATALPYIDTDRLSLLLIFGMRASQRGPIEDALIGSREIGKTQRLAIEAKIRGGELDAIPSSTARNTIRTVLEANAGEDVGFRRKNMPALLYRYFSDMARVLRNLHLVLRKGGTAAFVIGDNTTTAGGKEVAIRSGRALAELAVAAGFELVEKIPITVTKEVRLHMKHSITENDILRFRKA